MKLHSVEAAVCVWSGSPYSSVPASRVTSVLLFFPVRSGTVRRSGSTSPLGFPKTGASPPYPGEHGSVPSSRKLSFGGAKPFMPSPQGKMSAGMLLP